MALHPQVVALLEAAAKSPLPTMDQVAPFVARRLYRERSAFGAPAAPEMARVSFMLAAGVGVRAYRPMGTAKDEILPALVFFHGGGWTIGDLDTHDILCRQLASGARCAVFSVEYRLGPEAPFPAAVEDCVSATRFVISRATDLKIDAARIAVGGDSAGGNLATVVALSIPGLCFQLLVYPSVDQRGGYDSHRRNGEGYFLTARLMAYFRSNYLRRPDDASDWRASPFLAPSLKGLPPAYVMTAGYDPLLDEGRAYAERLRREGVATVYEEFPDMVHGFIVLGRLLDRANEAVAKCSAALRGAFEKVPA